MQVNQNGKSIEVKKCSVKISEIQVELWVNFPVEASSFRDLSSNNKVMIPRSLQSLIFQAKLIQLKKVRVKYKLNYPSQFLHMF